MKKVTIYLIRLYKKRISPVISARGYHCKFYPTCSEYSIQAFEKYGFVRGLFLTIVRLLKCNPFSKGGYDPLK